MTRQFQTPVLAEDHALYRSDLPPIIELILETNLFGPHQTDGNRSLFTYFQSNGNSLLFQHNTFRRYFLTVLRDQQLSSNFFNFPELLGISYILIDHIEQKGLCQLYILRYHLLGDRIPKNVMPILV